MSHTLVIGVLVAATPLLGLGASASSAAARADDGPAPVRTLTVDDDGAQCGPATYPTLQAAIDAARPHEHVRVCPGRYTERVTVDKPLSVTGRPGAVSALPCFAEERSEPDDLDTTVVPLLEPPDDVETPVLRVAADDVEVAGLVVQGVQDEEPEVTGDGYPLYDAAVVADDSRAGWRLHHNLLRLSFLAAELGSDGSRSSRFDHNCLRDDAYALANQRYSLSRARIDHNDSYRSQYTAYEIGWGYRGTRDVALERNTSSHDGLAVYAENDDHLLVRGNTIGQAGVGIVLAGGDTAPAVLGNTVTGTTAGAAVTVNPGPDAPPVTRLLLRGNTLSANAFSGFTSGPFAHLTGAVLSRNVATDNRRSGIVLAPGSRDNLLSRNVASTNAQVGIRLAAGTEGNLVTRNRMLDNTVADAADDTAVVAEDGTPRLANRWLGNRCVVDLPAGALC